MAPVLALRSATPPAELARDVPPDLADVPDHMPNPGAIRASGAEQGKDRLFDGLPRTPTQESLSKPASIPGPHSTGALSSQACGQ
jgi:hypothetical protein